MKSLLWVVLLAFVCKGTLHATSAYPGLVNYRQPDGSRIVLRIMGDENLHWAETEDGFTLLSDSEGYMTLALKDDKGDLQPSKARILPGVERELEFVKAVKGVKPHESFSEDQVNEAYQKRKNSLSFPYRKPPVRMSKTNGPSGDGTHPVIGERKFLVVLMQTSDVAFSYSSDDFSRLFNEVGYNEWGNAGSVHDYYYENSFGQLDLRCDVTPVYTAKYPMSYYGGNVNGSDVNRYEFAIEAIMAASNDYNLSDYDFDGDGFLDGIHIVFAGHGEESGGGDACIWSHQSTATPYFCYVNGVYMNKYSCSSELSGATGNNMSYIGVFCHEIGHILGTLDFYDTDYDNRGQCPGTGQWDLMGSGNWNGNGAVPAHFNPYTKIYDFGWSDVQNGNVSAKKTLHAKTKGDFVRIDTQTPGEYFLLEYRSQTGFDSALPGHGLMVYRVSDNLSRTAFNTINAHHPQQFYPLCANAPAVIPYLDRTATYNCYGSVNADSAPFPGSLIKTELTDNTCPSMKDWTGNNTSYPITDIAESKDKVSFNIAVGKDLPFNLHIVNANVDRLELGWDDNAAEVMLAYNSVNIFGEPGDKSYSAGHNIDGGGQIIYVGTDHSFTHEGLIQGKTYYYRLFTKSPSGIWNSDRSLTASTPKSIISSFPFSEDFSSGYIDDSWSQEYLSGRTDWFVESGRLLFSHTYQQQSTRIILPTFNFSGYENAYLKFDCEASSDDYVVYRTSVDGSWRLLKELESVHNLNNIYPREDFIHQVSVPLPELSATYQIALVSNSEVVIVDNIIVSVYDDVAVLTGNVLSVASSEADIDISTMLFADNVRVSSFGVEWSVDPFLEVINRVAASQGQSKVHLSDLPNGTKVTYRAYAVTEDGQTKYGEWKPFVTNNVSLLTGNGTKDSPYIISSAYDMDCLSKMEHTDGLYFELGASFSLPKCMNYDCYFYGNLDGKNHTITIDNCYSGVFSHIGTTGVVENLNICANSYETTNFFAGLLTYDNAGLVRNCDVHISDLRLSFSSRAFGGVAGRNDGSIQNCHSYINLKCENCFNGQACVGGICSSNRNHGTVEGCSFDGRIAVNNNSDTGGIAGSNSGIVRNCINRGELSIETVNGQSWFNSLGGIVGFQSNAGIVTGCVNEGTMNIDPRTTYSEQNYVGGIVGEAGGSAEGSYVSYCINRGSINIYYYSPKNLFCGGIAGDSYMGDISYCASYGDIHQLQTPSSAVQAVVGRHRGDNTFGCYYSCSLADQNATRVMDWEDAISAINKSAGYGCMSLSDSKPVISWEMNQGSLRFMAYDILDFSSTSIKGLFSISSTAKEVGVMFKKDDSDNWAKKVEDFTTLAHTFEIQGLDPLTWYSVKAYAVCQDGSVVYSDTKRLMTDMPYSGTQEDPYLIGSAADLKSLSIITHQGKSLNGCLVKMTHNIDLHADQGEVWTDLMGIFNGEFDGCGHYIYNAKIVIRDLQNGMGLFTRGNGYFHDLFFHNVDIDCIIDEYPFLVGSIVGECDRIERCGFVGNFTVSYEGNTYGPQGAVGGLAGKVNTEARDCYSFLTVSTGMERDFGSIIGTGNAYSSYSAILSTQYVRSILFGIGGYYTSKCTNCYYYKPMMVEHTEYNRKEIDMPVSQMKDGTLLSKLTPGVWVPNMDDQRFDYGFPILATQGPFPDPALGDANIDGIFTVSDFTAVANHLLELPNSRFSEVAADVNQDMVIDAADMTGIVNIILYGSSNGTSESMHTGISPDAYVQMSIPGFRVDAGETAKIPVYVQNVGMNFSAYQIDVQLPKGMLLTDVVLSKERTDARATDFFSWRELEPGRYRILCASTSGRTFLGNSGMVAELSLHASESMEAGNHKLFVSGITMAENANSYRVPDFSVSFTTSTITGVDILHDESYDQPKELYNLSGQHVREDYRGIVILNGTKSLLK